MSRVPVSRVLALLGAAQDGAGRVAVERAAELLGVRVRELPRLVEALSVIELPPHGDCLDVAIDGGQVIFQGLPTVARAAPLSPLDGALLLAALHGLRRSADRSLAQQCAAAARSVRSGLGEPAGSEAEARASALAWAVDGVAAPEVLATLREAAEARRVARLAYWNVSRDAVEERRVAPLALCQHTGRWYLGAIDLDRGAHRWFRVERVLGARATEETFSATPVPPVDRPVLYDPPRELVELIVRFDPGTRARARRQLSDAWAGVCGEGVRLAGPTIETLVRRLFALGNGWEVTAPAKARELVRRWARTLPS